MDFTTQQVMLTLSFIAYAGFAETGLPWRGAVVDRRIHDDIERALETLSPVKGQWEIAWGPATHQFPLTIFDDNLMFAVRSTADPARIAVVIRGTNPISLTNWLVEDFTIVRQVDWPYQGQATIGSPRLSKGSAIGLEVLQHLQPAEGLPGAGKTIYEFLRDEVMRSQTIELFVTGHSLGGALSAPFALWLHETRQIPDIPLSSGWDPTGRSALAVYPFAGPTPGNRDFAASYDSALDDRTFRGWNALDVAPLGWNLATIESVPGLYLPTIESDILVGFLVWVSKLIAKRGDYLQIQAHAAALPGGGLSKLFRHFETQMIYQHSLAYLEQLGLLDLISASYCVPFVNETMAELRRREERGLPSSPTRGSRRLTGDRPSTNIEPPTMKRLVEVPLSFLVQATEGMHLGRLMQRKRAFERRRREAATSSRGAGEPLPSDSQADG